MKEKKKISSQQDLAQRLKEVEAESQFYIERMQEELTSVSTYIPIGKIKESLNLASFADVSVQLEKHGMRLGVLMPMFLNNTFFKNKDDATKALVTALSLVLDGNIDLKGLAERLINYFSSSDGEKHLEDSATTLKPSIGITPRTFEAS
jgi:hypothetical protein